ncbi:sulfur transferase domain-containing protein [Myxococcota bacterium]|nr:sulfur transferase domain-containing protein [Myxococcota bacterium]
MTASLLGATVLGCAAKTPAPAADTTPPIEAKAAPTAPAIELPNGFLADGFVSAGQPTTADFERAKAAGYRAVINLRTSDEKGVESGDDVRGLGLAYVQIPVAGEADLTEANARALAAALADPAHQPAIVHCGSANRSGALFALKAFFVDGRSAADAVEHGKRLGLAKLEGYVRELLTKAEAERAAKP